MRVAPFGHLRIIAHLQLPAAFRSLSRPSSAPGAKASALRPNSLDQLLSDLLRFSFAVLARTRGLSHCHAVSPACPPVFPGRHNLSLPLMITPRFDFLFFVCIAFFRT